MRTAAYARYSSDQQSVASLEDQLRNCRTYCARQDWAAPVEFTDAAISGSRMDRPGYRRLLASAHQFDVIMVDDLSRLSRDTIESAKAVRHLVHMGVRLIGVSDGTDTAQKGYKIGASLRGLMSELYIDDLAEKTHRGLAGRALQGASAGGLPYGYRVTEVGQRAIDEAQAMIVRRVFAEYIAGKSPRAIAAALNKDRIPTARGTSWAMTVIYGDLRRGLGILANPIYVGRQVWNRSKWVKHPDTGRRLRQERPESEWYTTEHPELAIVDAATWNAAQARMRGMSPNRLEKPAGGPGRPARHILSGILRCDVCGGPLVIVDRYRYGCATHKDRGDAACNSRIRVPRAGAEEALLASIRKDLLSDAAFQRLQRAVAAELKNAAPDLDGAKRRIADAERVHANIMTAIRAGIITASTKAELVSAETDIKTARAALSALQQVQPAQMLPRLRETWTRTLAKLGDLKDVHGVRESLRELLGNSIVVKEKAGELFAEIAGSCQINLVAGAGFEPATFGL